MQPENYASRAYRGYALAVLTAVYTCNFIDRQILAILQEPIKLELGLSDTQLGVLSGVAFAVFYITCGIPIARFAERSSRRNVITLAIAAWSVMTALSGFAQNFTHLLLARIGVGIGESGGSPPSHSMISDIYPPAQRGTALAIFSTGINFGVLAGFLLGGWVNEIFGWRAAFAVVGLPGVLLALILRLTVAEPVRGMSDQRRATALQAPGIIEAVRLLASRPTFCYLSLACGMQSFGLYGIGNWFPSFMVRFHGMGTGELGTWLALIAGGVGALGALSGGLITDRLVRRDLRWYAWVPLLGGVLALPFIVLVLLLPNPRIALAVQAIPVFLTYMYLGPTLAVTHALVNARTRALASAILFFVLNLIGMGLGPLFTGALSDTLLPLVGTASLRYAMLATAVLAAVLASVCYAGMARHLRADMARAVI